MRNNQRKKRRKKSKAPLIIVLIILAVIAVVATMFVTKMMSTNVGEGSADDVISVSIPEGSNVNTIAGILAENNVVDSAEHFIFLCKINGVGSDFKFGDYRFAGNLDFFEIAEKLSSGDSVDNSIHITVKEGMWLSEIAETIAESGLCTKEEFLSAANSRDYAYDFVQSIPDRENLLEGYLYPETYFFNEGATASQIVDTMLNQFEKVCNENDIYTKASKSGMSIDDIVIIASLIESEVKYSEERNLVSSVIYNRINENMKLQIDASVIYSIGERVARVFYSDLEKEDEHNTYYVTGLPVGPICSPRGDSLVAAVEPADTDYLYYVVENQETGQHYFTADYNDFLEASERYKSTLN